MSTALNLLELIGDAEDHRSPDFQGSQISWGFPG